MARIVNLNIVVYWYLHILDRLFVMIIALGVGSRTFRPGKKIWPLFEFKYGAAPDPSKQVSMRELMIHSSSTRSPSDKHRWHPTEDVFVVGSMARPNRTIEVFSGLPASYGQKLLNLTGAAITTVNARVAFHPSIPNVIIGGTSSGRMTICR